MSIRRLEPYVDYDPIGDYLICDVCDGTEITDMLRHDGDLSRPFGPPRWFYGDTSTPHVTYCNVCLVAAAVVPGCAAMLAEWHAETRGRSAILL